MYKNNVYSIMHYITCNINIKHNLIKVFGVKYNYFYICLYTHIIIND